MPQFEKPFLATPCVHPRLNVDRIVFQNLLNFRRFYVVCGNVTPVLFIPVLPSSPRLHCKYIIQTTRRTASPTSTGLWKAQDPVAKRPATTPRYIGPFEKSADRRETQGL